MLHFQLCLKHT